ncbi:MAG: outer membrane protein assembly factor BamD [Deltaproteobacteria bacterium]
MSLIHHSAKRYSHISLKAAALLLFLLLALSGCAAMHSVSKFFGAGKDKTPASAETIAYGALDAFNHGKYEKALKAFDELKNRFPFSQFSLLAELKTADCKYYLADYAEAVLLYQEFEENHPSNEAVPYVMFQIGMCHYNQIDTIDRDPAGSYDSIQAFTRLLRSYPLSPYSDEARAKIASAKTFLANHEMYVADFYLRREEYKQAEGRLQYLVNNYPDSAPAPQARALLTALRSGKPPKRSWTDWLPEISLPTWKGMKGSVVPGVGGGAGPQQ